MIRNNENHLITIIRYTPPIFIILTSIIIFIFLSSEHKKTIQEEKQLIKSEFLKEEKGRIEDRLNRMYHFLKRKEESKRRVLETKIRRQVYNAYAVARSLFNKYKNSKSQDEIKELIKTALRELRFNNERGYFFIFELKGKTVLNARFPDFEGKNLWNYQDAKGTYLIQEMSKLMDTKSEVFYNWYWYLEENNPKQYKKIGFFKKFEPFDWFIGTGEYIDNYTKEVQQESLSHIKNLRYENDEYVYVVDSQGFIIANKYKELIGKNVALFDNYKNLHEANIKLKQNEELKGLFADYTQIIKDEQLHSKKVAYVKYFKDWDWIIGTGFLADRVNAKIELKEKMIDEKYEDYFFNLVWTTLILVLVLLLISYLMSKYLENIFYHYKQNIESKTKTLLQAQKVAHIGDWMLDLNTMKATWSDEIFKIFGIENKNQTAGPDLLKQIMHPDDNCSFDTSMENAIKTKGEHRCVYRIYKPDGEMRWIDCRGQVNPENNSILGTVQDITERILIEEEKKEKEKLLFKQSKMASMGEMIGNIAHQWRQPLSVITTVASGIQLKKEFDTLKDEELIESMDDIKNSANYLSQTIDDFRNFFQSTKNKNTCNVEDVFKKVLKLISIQFKNKDIKIIKEIQSVQINIFENELIQSLINIINNSKDELLTKSYPKYIFIHAKKENNQLIIEIKDNAGGISEKIMDRIFEPYFTTKHQSQGTGIGLYMTQEIIQKHLKGTIEVENEEYVYEEQRCKGAKFTITLPLQENE